jgi:hypothetical protein
VADYEVQNGGDEELNAGGRAATKFLDGRVETGVSYIRDAESSGKTDLGGVDVKVKLLPDTELRLEAAAATGSSPGRTSKAAPTSPSSNTSGSASTRSCTCAGRRPSSGSDSSSRPRTARRSRACSAAFRSAQDRDRGRGLPQENLRSDVERLAGVVRSSARSRRAGVRRRPVRARRGLDGDEFESQQIVLGASRKFLADKLDLLGQADVSIGGKDDSIDFPSRYLAQAATTSRSR